MSPPGSSTGIIWTRRNGWEMDVHDALAEAVDLLQAGRSRAFGGGAVVDRDRVLALIEQIRASLPDEVVKAAAVLGERDRVLREATLHAESTVAEAKQQAEAILADAREEARVIVAQSHQEHARLLEEHQVVEQARQRALEIEAAAAAQASAMRADVDGYVSAKLTSLAGTLEKALSTVEAGRQRVSAREADRVEMTLS